MLVLSEFAGAVDELTDAVIVNPHDPDALVGALVTAIDLRPRRVARRGCDRCAAPSRRNDVNRWARVPRRLPSLRRRRADDRRLDVTDDPRELATHRRLDAQAAAGGTDIDGTLSEITVDPVASTARLRCASRRCSPSQERGCDGRRGLRSADGRPRSRSSACPASLHLVGSHGVECGADPASATRTPQESSVLEAVDVRCWSRVAAEHEGAGVETQAVRRRRCTCGGARRRSASGRCSPRAAPSLDLDGVRLFDGHMVLEATVRPTSKRMAMGELRERLQPATTVFVGDDASDEGVFESLSAGDVAVKVGPGVTLASHRLGGPQDAAQFLTTLASLV